MRSRVLSMLALAAAALVLGLAGCGDDEDENGGATPAAGAASQPTTGTVLLLSADPKGQLRYQQTEITVKAGQFSLEFTNKASVPHDVVIEGENGKEVARTKEITDSKTTAKVGKLAKGKYRFYCSVPGHEEAGMKGELTVQ